MKLLQTNKYIHFVHDEAIVKHQKALYLILSPAFYWCKRQNLKIKRIYQAKSIAASVFYGSLPEGTYKYFVVKQNDDFVFFAYDEEFILNKLKALGFKLSLINAIYFAQTEFDNLNEAIMVNDKHSLICHQNTVSIINNHFADARTYIDLSQHQLSRYKVPFSTLNPIGIKDSTLYKLAFTLLFLLMVFIGENFLIQSFISQESDRYSQILSDSGLPPTSFQINSIKQSLLKEQKRYQNFSNKLQTILKAPRNKKEYWQSLVINSKGFEGIYVIEGNQSQDIKSYLQSKLKNAAIKPIRTNKKAKTIKQLSFKVSIKR